MWAIPEIDKIKITGGVFISNTPINMDKVITFDTDTFNGVTFDPAPDSPNVPQYGTGIFHHGDDPNMNIGEGSPAITFKIGHKPEDCIQWMFEKEVDMNAQFDKLVKLIKGK